MAEVVEEKKPKGILRKPGDEPREPKGDIKVEAGGTDADSGNRRNNLARKDTGGPVKKNANKGAITSIGYLCY
jgi:hypothetical protein